MPVIRCKPFAAYRLAAAFLVIGLGASAWLAALLWRESAADDNSRFQMEVERIVQHWDARLELFVQGLIGLQRSLSQAEQLTPAVWARAVEDLNAPANFPGICEIGYAEKVALTNIHAHREEMLERFGPSYSVRPLGTNDHGWAAPVTLFSDCSSRYHESLTFTNWGYNLLRKEHDWRVIRYATAVNLPVSGGIWNKFESNRTLRGFQLFFPVYRHDRPAELPESRDAKARNATLKELRELSYELNRRYIRGWLFASFDLLQFLEGSFGNVERLVDFAVYDAATSPPTELLGRNHLSSSALSTNRLLLHYSRKLRFDFHTTQIFTAQSTSYRSGVAAAGGGLISFLVAGTMAMQARARVKEQKIYDGFIARLQESEVLLLRRQEQLERALEDRQTLSRNLHDGTIQSIYGIGLTLQRCRKRMPSNPAEAEKLLVQSLAELRAVTSELRHVIQSEQPPEEIDLCLSDLLANAVRRFGPDAIGKTAVNFEPGLAVNCTPKQAVHIVNIVREALSNSLRHSQPRTININARMESGVLEIEICDDGFGFEMEGERGRGRGLHNMAARAAEISGELQVQSTPSTGTVVKLRIPCTGG